VVGRGAGPARLTRWTQWGADGRGSHHVVAERGAAGIRMPDGTLHELAAGTTVDGASAKPNSVFLTSGITGTVVEAIAWKLIDQGTLDAELVLATWLPDYPNADLITVRMLLDELSGLGDPYTSLLVPSITADPERTWSLQEVVNLMAAVPPSATPGTFTTPTPDTVRLVIAYVLEQVTGRTVAELIDTMVAKPLGLDDTSLADGSNQPANFSEGLFVLDGSLIDTRIAKRAYLTMGGASWGLQSTTADLANLVESLMSGQFLGAERAPTADHFSADRATSDGLAWVPIGVPFSGYRPCTGDTPTFTSYGKAVSETGTAVTMLTFPDGISIVLHLNATPIEGAALRALVLPIHDIIANN